jgi:CBS-domain-containing membrane protein
MNRRVLVRVCDGMTRDLITVKMSATLSRAKRAMRERQVRHLPVVNNHDRLVGIVTDRDLRDYDPTVRGLSSLKVPGCFVISWSIWTTSRRMRCAGIGDRGRRGITTQAVIERWPGSLLLCRG